MKRIAVIPARGGSKRLPRKNIKPFLGKPLIAFTIEAAIKADIFDRIIVSTEDSEIAEISEQYGATVLDRSINLADDHATVVQVCLDVLDREKIAGRLYEVMCCLYATAPLRNEDDIKQIVNMVKPEYCEFALAVTNYFFTPFQALYLDNNKFLKPMWPEWIDVKSQNTPDLLIDNGSTYVVSVAAFYKYRTFYGPSLQGYIMKRNLSIDIDTQEDFDFLQNIAKNHK